MKNNFFLTIFTLYCSVNLAQTKEVVTPTSSSPSKIKVYTPNTSQTSKEDNTYKWVVKTDLFGFISGEFPVALEYRIAEKISLEGSAGITYSYIPHNTFSENENDNSGFDTKASIGSAFRGTLKYYPSSDYDAIEGWFFGIQVFNKISNREYISGTDSYGSLSPSSNSNNLNGKIDSKTKTGISLIIGKQIFQDSNIAFESYFGIGLASVSRNFYTRFYDSNFDNYYVEMSTKETLPNFQLGFKIGFGN